MKYSDVLDKILFKTEIEKQAFHIHMFSGEATQYLYICLCQSFISMFALMLSLFKMFPPCVVILYLSFLKIMNDILSCIQFIRNRLISGGLEPVLTHT